MKNLIGLFIGLIISISTVNAQDNYGFYGKKTFLDISSSTYIPLIYNVTSYGPGYVLSPSGNSLISKHRWLNIGVRASIGRAVKSNLGVALEFGFDQVMLGGHVLNGSGSLGYVEKHENLLVNSILIMPRFEISGPNGLLPNGLVHQIGVGVSINKVVEKNYLVEYSGGTTTGGANGTSAEQEALNKEDNLDRSQKLVQLMYGLKMRAPIGKSLMINYGFRYTLDFGGVSSYLGTYSVAREIRRYQFRNVIAFDLGLTLPF